MGNAPGKGGRYKGTVPGGRSIFGIQNLKADQRIGDGNRFSVYHGDRLGSVRFSEILRCDPVRGECDLGGSESVKGSRVRCIFRGRAEFLDPEFPAVMRYMGNTDGSEFTAEHISAVSLTGIVFICFFPCRKYGKRGRETVMSAGNVFASGIISARKLQEPSLFRSGGTGRGTVRTSVVPVKRSLQSALHGSTLQGIVVSERFQIRYGFICAAFIAGACFPGSQLPRRIVFPVCSEPEGIHHGEHGPGPVLVKNARDLNGNILRQHGLNSGKCRGKEHDEKP